ncbi:MAG: tetratricopeptide repeat protein, partial [Thermoanaerobaculia bacterium]
MEVALVHQTAGQPQEARNLYRQTLALAPNTHDALHMLGVIELGFGNLQLAEELILEAIKL